MRTFALRMILVAVLVAGVSVPMVANSPIPVPTLPGATACLN